MDKYISPAKRRCKAMIDAGIEDPESSDGIRFCAGSRDGEFKSQCPYNYCVVVEYGRTSKQLAVDEEAAFVKDLQVHKVSLDDIALIIGKSLKTVRRRLKNK